MELTAAQRIRADAKGATRRALLAAGLQETIARGGVVPSIEAISARAGFTRGAFYVHFKGRSDFVVEMLGWVVGDIFEAIFRRAGEDQQDLRGIVTRFVDILVKGEWPDVSDIRAAYLSVIAGLRDSPRVRQRHAELMEAAIARLEQAMSEAQRAGVVRGDLDPRKGAEMLLVLGIGLIVWDHVGIPIGPTALRDYVLALLSAPEAGSISGEAPA